MNWHEMTSQQQWQTLQSMETNGDSFVSALALVWYRVDRSNCDKLAAAFPELIKKYQPREAATELTHCGDCHKELT